MNPNLEDEVAELLRNAYGGFANVELTDDGGVIVWICPEGGGSIHARLAGLYSPVLTALLAVRRAASTPEPGDRG